MDRVYALRRRLLGLLHLTNPASATLSNYLRHCRPWLLRQSSSFELPKVSKTSNISRNKPSTEFSKHAWHQGTFKGRPEKVWKMIHLDSKFSFHFDCVIFFKGLIKTKSRGLYDCTSTFLNTFTKVLKDRPTKCGCQ